MKCTTRWVLSTLTVCVAMLPQIAVANSDACASLVVQSTDRMEIVATTWVEAGADHDTNADLPAYCRVDGIIDAHLGAGDRPLGQKFDLRMPDNWNGRFYFQGGGGLDGRVRPAIGSGQPDGNTPALAEGYAVISTNAGHDYPDGSFGFDTEAREVWGYRAIEDVTLAGKSLVSAYFGEDPHHSYLVGCSNGGRQGMMASQRYPDLYDGIVAGAPVFRLSRSHIDTAWGLQNLTAIAPENDDGDPILARAYSDADLALLSDDILAACDGLDGLEDGLVSDVGQCDYDPARLQCNGDKNESCLSTDQVRVMQTIHSGSHDSAGHAWYVPWPFDPGIADEGWRRWRLGDSETKEPNAIKAGLSNNGIKHVFITPADGDFDIQNFDFDTDPLRMEASADFADAVSADLSAFRDRGGKILIYHGASDPATSAFDTARYYDKLTQESGGLAATTDFARLFLVPGMGHCRGGTGLDEFDALAAIVAWVEENDAPETLTASSTEMPSITRPLCPYPTTAFYDGSGNTNSAGSFSCK